MNCTDELPHDGKPHPHDRYCRCVRCDPTGRPCACAECASVSNDELFPLRVAAYDRESEENFKHELNNACVGVVMARVYTITFRDGSTWQTNYRKAMELARKNEKRFRLIIS